jgi:hypothetical protein
VVFGRGGCQKKGRRRVLTFGTRSARSRVTVLNFALSICTSGAGVRRVNASKPFVVVILARRRKNEDDLTLSFASLTMTRSKSWFAWSGRPKPPPAHPYPPGDRSPGADDS